MLPSQTVALVLAGLLAAAPAAAQVGVQTILVADSSGPPIETTVSVDGMNVSQIELSFRLD